MKDYLPEDIVLDILSRLPAESVLRFIEVCRTWRTSIKHPSFAQMHLKRLVQLEDHKYQNDSNVAVKEDLSFLFDIRILGKPRQLNYGEYGGNCYKNFRKFKEPLIKNERRILGSCNGLICFCECDRRTGIYEPVCISNPITREYVNLPRLDSSNGTKINKMVFGFGYHPSTKEYKVVRIYYSLNKPLGQVQVYTLRSDSQWREIGQIAYSLKDSSMTTFFFYSVFVNGAIHWLDQEEKIVAFDLADEVFHVLPSPPCVRIGCFHLRELGGCLSLLHYEIFPTTVAIWLLKEDCWSKEFTIAIGATAYPFSITNSGKVLLWYNSTIRSITESNLCLYDPKTATLQSVRNPTRFVIHTVIPHMNTLVSM